ncbi:peptidyl-prolyl cis-trans isomerase [bacterium]|nr:peptidyl-prolyl cis-trans isomerase [bacterium]
MKKNLMTCACACAGALLLTGCDFGSVKNKVSSLFGGGVAKSESKKFDDATVVAKVLGKPYVTKEAFDKKLGMMLASSPYTKDIDPGTIPAEAKRKFLEDWLNFAVIKEVWGGENKVENSKEFKETYAERLEAVKDSVVVDMFVKDVRAGITVSDSDIKGEFEKNKGRYVKVMGGTKVAGVSFKDNGKAKDFLSSAKGTKDADKFEDITKDVDGTFKDFGRVGEEQEGAPQDIPASVRKAALSSKSTRVELVKDGDVSWVLHLSDKKDSVYFELDEIRPQVKAMIEEAKYKEVLELKVTELKKRANIEVNEAFFAGSQQPRVITAEDLKKLIKTREDVDEEDAKAEVKDAEVNA